MKEEVRTYSFVLSIAALVELSLPMPAHAQLRGAIFQTVASLPDGTYVFQVTDPSGKTLLSTDFAICRQFTVANGIITGVVPAGGCQHLTGFDIEDRKSVV